MDDVGIRNPKGRNAIQETKEKLTESIPLAQPEGIPLLASFLYGGHFNKPESVPRLSYPGNF